MQRPFTEELLQYAACDVRYLHLLADALNKKLPQNIIKLVGFA
jgi:ribonuclease D